LRRVREELIVRNEVVFRELNERAGPARLIADVERVVRREDGHAIVEKHDPERELALLSNPRS
jgi:hypothetical protein